MKHQQTLKQTTVYSCFSAAAEIWQKLLGGTCLLFSILLLLVEKLEIILNKHKEWHWFCAVYFCLTLLIKMCFLISIFLCFALVPKLVPRTVDFHWYWYRILKFWYRDNTSGDMSKVQVQVVWEELTLAVSCADRGAEGIVWRAFGGMTVTVCWKTTSDTGDGGLFNTAKKCKY